MDGHPAALLNSVSAAVRPLRTADSMVAGQPVSVHAPAITRLESAVVGAGSAHARGGDERGVRIARGRTAKQLRARGLRQHRGELLAAELDELALRSLHEVIGRAQAAADVSG